MRCCNMCKKEKELKDFPRNKSRALGYGYECKNCINELVKKRKQEQRDKIRSLKTPCLICGEDDPIVIDFHHLDPNEKELSLNQAGASMNKILKEIDKCVCLCANCHRRVHAGTVEIPT